MTRPLPSAAVVEGLLTVIFSDCGPSRSVDFKCVVDLSDFGDVVGVEVIDWRGQVPGGTIDAPRVAGPVRWSYDDEFGDLYLHLGKGRSQLQVSRSARAFLDSHGSLVRLDIPAPPSPPWRVPGNPG